MQVSCDLVGRSLLEIARSCANSVFIWILHPHTYLLHADFCSGGTAMTPNESVNSILINQGYNSSDILVQAIKFYTNQCQDPSGNPVDFIQGYVEQIDIANTQVAALDVTLSLVGLDRLELLCGRDFQEMANLTKQMSTNLGILKSSGNDTLELLRCDRIVPIYTSTVFDGTCNYSVQGVTWTFAGMLFYCICAIQWWMQLLKDLALTFALTTQ